MRRKLMWLTLCTAAIGFVALYQAEFARATPASGFAGTNLLPFTATFQDFQVFNHLTQDQLNSLLRDSLAIPGYPFKRHRVRQTCTCRAILGSLAGAPAGIGTLVTASS